MTPLRQQMIDAKRQRGFSVRTHQSYLAAVAALARHFRRSPSQLQYLEKRLTRLEMALDSGAHREPAGEGNSGREVWREGSHSRRGEGRPAGVHEKLIQRERASPIHVTQAAIWVACIGPE